MSALPGLLVTGGAGFIASEFVRQAREQGFRVAVVDKLTYAGDRERLRQVAGREVRFYKADICNPASIDRIFDKERPAIVIHTAAETHVDRSILDGAAFLRTNIEGTRVLLEAARGSGVKRFVHLSTDEVYGEIESGRFTERSPLSGNSPYAVSKTAADLLVQSYQRTYGVPAVIVRASNNYGPWQYPEKLLPVVIYKALNNQKIPVYGKGHNVREWLYVSDCAHALFSVMERGEVGEAYNVGSAEERRNIDTVKAVLALLNKPQSLIEFVKDRPGHDVRYALCCNKVRKLGWKPQVALEEGLERTIAWYVDNRKWLDAKVAQVQDYWRRVYGK
jgi:dTDP-glucose 4,6-dehydratase